MSVRLKIELAAAIARAEAAEAVIAEAVQVLSKSLPSSRREGLAILRTAPQTVLAERDRKNRREAWDEGSHAAYEHVGRCEDAQAAGQGVMIYAPVNPYVEKERSNAGRKLSNLRGVASSDLVPGLGDGVGGASVLDYAEATAKYVGVDPELVRAALAAAVAHPEPTEGAK